MWSIDQFNWVETKYSVSPIIFGVIWLATVPFTWWAFFEIIYYIRKILKEKSNKNKHMVKLVAWIVWEAFLLALPYLYLLFFAKNIHYLIKVLLVFIIIWSLYGMWMKIKKKITDVE